MQSKACLTRLRLASSEQTAGYKNGSQRTFNANLLTLFFGPITLLLWLVLTLASPGGVTAAPPEKADGPPPLVTVAAATLQDVNPAAEYVGHIEAIQAVDVRAR